MHRTSDTFTEPGRVLNIAAYAVHAAAGAAAGWAAWQVFVTALQASSAELVAGSLVYAWVVFRLAWWASDGLVRWSGLAQGGAVEFYRRFWHENGFAFVLLIHLTPGLLRLLAM